VGIKRGDSHRKGCRGILKIRGDAISDLAYRSPRETDEPDSAWLKPMLVNQLRYSSARDSRLAHPWTCANQQTICVWRIDYLPLRPVPLNEGGRHSVQFLCRLLPVSVDSIRRILFVRSLDGVEV